MNQPQNKPESLPREDCRMIDPEGPTIVFTQCGEEMNEHVPRYTAPLNDDEMNEQIDRMNHVDRVYGHIDGKYAKCVVTISKDRARSILTTRSFLLVFAATNDKRTGLLISAD